MFSASNPKPNITIYQMVDAQGTPYRAAHTEPLWVDRNRTDVFSEPTLGNKIISFTTGTEYFADLVTACDAATSEIYIVGWQVNWDALLTPTLRLYDLLYRCAKRGVNIYVMPWDDIEPVQTYDDQTKVVLESMNTRLQKEGSKGRLYVNLCASYASMNNGYYSQHQKQVLIDRRIAYIGGIDLAYGRMDDATYDLRADAHGRQVLNRYNPGIPPLQELKPGSRDLIVDPDRMIGPSDKADTIDPDTGEVITPSNAKIQAARIAAGGWQVRYEKAGATGTVINSKTLAANTVEYTTLDPARQPRMPWQDIHSKIEGPAVSDLLRNFILRWNTVSKKWLPLPKPSKEFAKVGNAQIQVLRSAPKDHCATENKANRIKGGAKTQLDIHVAMETLIGKATRFIYIENQFFVSDFGQIGGLQDALSPAAQYIKDGKDGISDAALWVVRKASSSNKEELDAPPRNGVLQALLARFKTIIVDDFTRPKFHVYITLPVHPEGSLYEASIAVQVYWTMQTLVFGSHSLINGIKRCIKARELKDNKDTGYMRVINDAANTEHESVSTEACYEYVTLLNLRNWDKLGSHYVTEQIYVHSKVMIVDDRFALLGSANINDRSLLGERDSEIAILVQDNDSKRADINGKGSNQPVRLFAHELRKKIWSKLFGITGNVRPASELQRAIDEPGDPESWKMIQKQAAKNAALYEAAFPFVPRNKDPNDLDRKRTASIIPVWNQDPKVNQIPIKKGLPPVAKVGLMPFEENFWNAPQHTAAASHLSEIKGFITALPVEWTKDEDIHILFPSAMVVQNDAIKDSIPNPPKTIVGAVDQTPENKGKG